MKAIFASEIHRPPAAAADVHVQYFGIPARVYK